MYESEKDAMLRNVIVMRATLWLPLAAAVVLSVAPLRAQGAAATVVEMTGQVSVLKDGYPVALFQGNFIREKQVVQTGPDGYAKFQLSDGSTFEVFPNAQITFRDHYPSWMDLVTVWLGRIRVHIDRSKGDNPNSVSTPTAVISVRGTTFDVSVEDSAATTLVSVEEGIVVVRHRLQPNSREITLRTGESIHVFRDQPLARVVDRSPIYRQALDAVRQALYEVALRRNSSTGAGVPGGGVGGTTTSGDSSKNGGSSGGSTSGSGGGSSTPTAPGAPPAPASSSSGK
jgi:hypothetical protein